MSDSYFVTYGNNRLTFGGEAGSIAWAHVTDTMVLLNPYRTSNADYLKMRFVTPGGDEIIIEDGSAGNVSASAMVPVGSTAYFTANGFQGDAETTTKYHVTALANSGFSGVSSENWSNVTTMFYSDPNVETHGSAVLTATGSASAQATTHMVYKCSYGEGNTYSSTMSASGFAPAYTGSWNGNAGRAMWIPRGSRIGFSAAGPSANTYSVDSTLSAISGAAIAWDHRQVGSHTLITGYADRTTAFRLNAGRIKGITAYGVFVPCGNANCTTWEPSPRITSFTSNLNTGFATNTYLSGGNSAQNSTALYTIYGFASGSGMGSRRTTSNTWVSDTNSNKNYWYPFNFSMVRNSAYASAVFSSKRTGAGSTNNSEWMFYGRNANGSYRVSNGTYSLGGSNGATARIYKTQGNVRDGNGQYGILCLDSTVSIGVKAISQCSGVFTGSGRLF